jgi:hypothetical protein
MSTRNGEIATKRHIGNTLRNIIRLDMKKKMEKKIDNLYGHGLSMFDNQLSFSQNNLIFKYIFTLYHLINSAKQHKAQV